MKTIRIVAICLVIAAVLALTGIGHRGFHWFPVFVVFAGFLIGIALDHFYNSQGFGKYGFGQQGANRFGGHPFRIAQ